MKTYLVTYSLEGHVHNGGAITVKAEKLEIAYNKFFTWLSMQSFYGHMFSINVEAREIEGILQ